MKTEIAAVILSVLLASSPVYAGLGTQSFPSVNFSDNVITDAELELAETTFSNPGIMPNNPLYFMKQFSEKMRLLFAFDPNEKAKLHIEFTKTRLAEAKELMKKNATKKAKESIEGFNSEIEMLNTSIKHGKSPIIASSEDFLEKSSLVLGIVLENAPEEAKPAIENALNKSIEKKVRIKSKIAEKEDEDEIKEEISRELKRHHRMREFFGKPDGYRMPEKDREPVICIQVITPARNPETGEIVDFPTPCDVPENWEKLMHSGEAKGLDLPED